MVCSEDGEGAIHRRKIDSSRRCGVCATKCNKMPLDLGGGLEADDGGKKARSDRAEMESGRFLILSWDLFLFVSFA